MEWYRVQTYSDLPRDPWYGDCCIVEDEDRAYVYRGTSRGWVPIDLKCSQVVGWAVPKEN